MLSDVLLQMKAECHAIVLEEEICLMQNGILLQNKLYFSDQR